LVGIFCLRFPSFSLELSDFLPFLPFFNKLQKQKGEPILQDGCRLPGACAAQGRRGINAARVGRTVGKGVHRTDQVLLFFSCYYVFSLDSFFIGFQKQQQRKGSLGDWRDGFAVGWKKNSGEQGKNGRCNQQQLNEISTQTQQSRLLKESARLKRLLGQSSNLEFFFGFSGGR
jgi:hypothetical protein